jgi:acetyltransferase-like isoleucine patch superfamily enzyme
MRNGRYKFKKMEATLLALSKGLSLLPGNIRRLFWDLSRPFAGSIALGLRYALLKVDAKHVGAAVYIGRNVTILNATMLRVGDNVSIHENCYIDAIGGCFIGNDVSIAHSCSIITFDHDWAMVDSPIKYNPVKIAEVRINDDVWIGAAVRILKGVDVGRRSIIAAGAVVTSDVDTKSIFGGVPARKIRTL